MSNEQVPAWQEHYSSMLFWKFDGILSNDHIVHGVAFMEKALQVKKGNKVLDLGCGLGGHSIELARRGYDVTGLDWSEIYLNAARRQAAETGVSVQFLQGDMTNLAFDERFDAVVLWGNTFGEFEHEDNVQTLYGIRRALRKGGRALIDTQNYQGLPDKLTQDWSFDNEDPNLLMLTQGTKDVARARFGFDVLAINLATGERQRLPYSWRLYLLPELESMIRETGMNLTAVYGDDPKKVDWKGCRPGDPYPYAPEGYTDAAAKRILLCQV